MTVRGRKLVAILLVALLSTVVALAQSGEKVALVIGINQYDVLTDLKASVNDADLVASYYTALGFNVWRLDDSQTMRMNQPSLPNARRVMQNISEYLANTPVEELVVFFAGHGVQVAGESYLCFPETELESREGMLDFAVEMIPWIRGIHARLALVYLDACRNELGPVRSAGFGTGLAPRGLTEVSSNEQSLAIIYGARPGTFSYEKADGSNGFFTEVLVEALQSENTRSIQDLFTYLRAVLPRRTEAAYGQVQIPHLGGDFDLFAAFSRGRVEIVRDSRNGQLYVQITGAPTATISINGQVRGEAPIFLDELAPGAITVEARNRDLYGVTQVTISPKSYHMITVELAPVTGSLFLEATRSSTEAEDIGYPDFVKGLTLSLDGSDRLLLDSPMVTGLAPGTWNLSLHKRGWYWEDVVTVKPLEVVRIQPLFAPVGTVELSLPEESRAILRNDESSMSIMVDTTEEEIPAIPVGSWTLELTGRTWDPVVEQFVVKQGERIRLSPETGRKAEYRRGDEVLELNKAIDSLVVELDSRDLRNGVVRRFTRIGTGIGIGTALVGGALLADSCRRYQAYQLATDSATAQRLHESTLFTYRLGLSFAIAAGSGFAGSLGTLLFRKPTSTIESELQILKDRTRELTDLGVAFDG